MAQKVGQSLCFSVFYFHAYTIRINCGKLQKIVKTFSCAKRHKMTFSLVFLLKIGKLHFYDYLRNKAHSPTLNFAICLSRQITYVKKSKIQKL